MTSSKNFHVYLQIEVETGVPKYVIKYMVSEAKTKTYVTQKSSEDLISTSVQAMSGQPVDVNAPKDTC